MKVLLSNDDGITSPFLRIVAEVFSQQHELVVAAPANEQSWIGKAMSRQATVEATEVKDFPCRAFELTGTPSDCVNIALEHLCSEKPDVVVSGINIGHNAGLSFIASSGTIGAALEGALQKLPAVAASMYLDPEQFQTLVQRDRPLLPEMEAHVYGAAEVLESCVAQILKTAGNPYGVVHSFNFPCRDIESARIVKARAAHTVSQSLFERKGNRFHFVYKPLETLNQAQASDRQLVHQGNISHTIIDYTAIDNASY